MSERAGPRACLSLEGELTAERISQVWPRLLSSDKRCLDLSKVTQIDSAGLAAIITAFKPNPQRPIKLCNCPAQAKQLLSLYELEALVEFAKQQ